jgi:uncharacterized protein (TIGR04255 family)
MPQHYNHAPIVEAIIDLRAALPDDTALRALNSFSESLSDQFPTVKEITAVSMGFHKEERSEGQFHSRLEKVGLRLDNARGDRVLQVQRLGFTYSHLAPYSDWITFREEAKILWSRYIEANGISQVTRLAVRVINKVRLPTAIADLSRYSSLLAHLPKDIPSTPETFFIQMQLNGDAWVNGSRVLVNAGAAPQPDAQLELLLDFDLFVEATKAAASPEIWEILDKLSAAKDDLFEACITDDTRKLIA